MEEKINVAEILKNKSQGTKLYSRICGAVELKKVIDVRKKKSIVVKELNSNNQHRFWHDGNFFKAGQCVLQPSENMADWSKFLWKKGDVLVSNDGKERVIFVKFQDNRYMRFFGKFFSQIKEDGDINYKSNLDASVNDYTLENMDAAQTYIKAVEERCGGKLNKETLEVEKSEFKDGDIVCISGMGYLAYGIVKSIDNSSKKLEYYVLNDMSTLKFEDWLSFEDKQIQPITETQRIILFDALAKKGKAWDAAKKQIVDLKLKWTPKPFDKVVVRCGEADKWSIDFFSYKVSNGYICTGDAWFGYCLPYNEETAHLLGTTDDWEGDEQ